MTYTHNNKLEKLSRQSSLPLTLNSSNNYNNTNTFQNNTIINNKTIIDENFINTLEYNTIKQNWLVNLTNITIPKEVCEILSLGDNFNFTNELNKSDYFELLKCLQFSMYRIIKRNNNSDKIYRKVISAVNKNLHNKNHISYTDKQITKKLNLTKNFLKNNPDVLVTKANKGNSTVILTYEFYNNKVENELLNTDSYIHIDHDPLEGFTKQTLKFLKKWNNLRVFNCDECFVDIELDISNTNLPRAYALIKIHKNGFPIRIIVSFINSPLYIFDKCLTKFLQKYIKKPSSIVKNSKEIINLLKNNVIPDEYELASLDVVAMFPSIPHNLVIQAIERNWESLANSLPISKSEFLTGINFLLTSTYLQFNNKYYKQIKDLPMGFCSSPFLTGYGLANWLWTI